MKNVLFSLMVGVMMMGAQAQASKNEATTTISGNRITYLRSMSPADPQGIVYYMAVAQGKVDFTGPGPVNVTLKNGKQLYSAITDQSGHYTFFFAVESRDVVVDAWLPGSTTKWTGKDFLN